MYQKIFVLGDTHARGPWTKKMIRRAAYEGCDAILQLGDFGVWEHTDNGEFLSFVSHHATKQDIPFYWVDGNHENFDLLYDKYVQGNYDDFVKIRENLFYAPRGFTWEWSGTTFLAMGGGVSIDKKHRIPGESWWPQETITQEEIERMRKNIDGVDVDILVTHDAPINPLDGLREYKMDAESAAHRMVLRDIVNEVQPRLNIHGHYHYWHDTVMRRENGETRVVGLNRDGGWSDAWGILNLPYESDNDLTFPNKRGTESRRTHQGSAQMRAKQSPRVEGP